MAACVSGYCVVDHELVLLSLYTDYFLFLVSGAVFWIYKSRVYQQLNLLSSLCIRKANGVQSLHILQRQKKRVPTLANKNTRIQFNSNTVCLEN